MDVLLVDGEPGMLEQTKTYLEKENGNFKIDTVSTVDKALATLDKHDYDAVVSDYMMPDKDGLELLKMLRKDRSSDIPYIIFTGRSEEDVAIEALNLGANHYIRKKGDPKSQYKDLAQAITQEVEHQRKYKEKEKLEEKLSSLVDGSGDYIYVVNEDCDILFANKPKLDHYDLTIDEISSVNINSILKNTIVDNKYKASEKNIEIIYKKKDYVVQGGPLLKELFSNIIENSVEHSDCDKIKISFKEVDDELMIVIEDDGKGISEDDKKKIFEKGFKKGGNAGSGLGMYLVKQIAENYGGKVEVKDSHMGGARFDVRLKRPQ